MTEGAPRVVLLSAPGGARERLQVAVQEAGAELVLVGDATEVDADAVLGLAPHAVVVVVDGGSEPALVRLEPLLADPGISVLFEDADLIAARDGWDAARWLRHLSAKLHRHQDVLPPVPEGTVRSTVASPGTEPPLPAPPSGAVENASPFDPLQWETDAVRIADTDAAPETVSPGPAAQVPASAGGMFSNLSLVDQDAEDAGATAPVVAAREQSRGAVLVIGGMGAPDAVRQLLGHLPAGFPRPVLVRMQMQGGRYDRLVKQMGKATSLPVALAASGEPLHAGHVYFLPPDLSVATQADGLVFAAGAEAWPQALDPAESALLLLSGCDAALAEQALELQAAEVLCLAQSADTAYDAAAANAWSALGGAAADPAGLVAHLSARWPA